MTVNVQLPRIEPSAYYADPRLRAICGPFITGAVTFNTDFGQDALWIWVGGTVTVDIAYQRWDGVTETLVDVSPGQWHRITAKRINSSGTTIAAADLRWGN